MIVKIEKRVAKLDLRSFATRLDFIIFLFFEKVKYNYSKNELFIFI